MMSAGGETNIIEQSNTRVIKPRFMDMPPGLQGMNVNSRRAHGFSLISWFLQWGLVLASLETARSLYHWCTQLHRAQSQARRDEHPSLPPRERAPLKAASPG